VVDVDVVLLRADPPGVDELAAVTAGAIVVVVDGRVDTALCPCGSEVVDVVEAATDVFGRCGAATVVEGVDEAVDDAVEDATVVDEALESVVVVVVDAADVVVVDGDVVVNCQVEAVEMPAKVLLAESRNAPVSMST
jgi:hypothetical protein